MKITLINLATHPALAGKNKAVYPLTPHSLLTVGSYMKTHPGVEVELLDENLRRIDFDTLESDCVGFSVMSALAKRIYSVADKLRARGVRVMLGGVHATVLPEEVAQHADVVVSGEFEAVGREVLNDLVAGTPKPMYQSREFPDLDNQPCLDFSLVDVKRYYAPVISATRGCPYSCEFCSINTIYGHKIRHRPVEHVLSEIKQLPPNPVLLFADDNLVASRTYAKELFTALKSVRMRWGAQVCVNFGQYDDLLTLASEAGCQLVLVGLETLDEVNLETMDKAPNQISEYKGMIANIRAHGIDVNGSFIVGFDNDDAGVFGRIEKFVDEASLDAVNLELLRPYPKTRLRERLAREGRLFGETDWDRLNDFAADFIPKKMTPDQLVEGYRTLNKRLCTWSAIARRVWRAPRKRPALETNIGARNRLSRLSLTYD